MAGQLSYKTASPALGNNWYSYLQPGRYGLETQCYNMQRCFDPHVNANQLGAAYRVCGTALEWSKLCTKGGHRLVGFPEMETLVPFACL